MTMVKLIENGLNHYLVFIMRIYYIIVANM